MWCTRKYLTLTLCALPPLTLITKYTFAAAGVPRKQLPRHPDGLARPGTLQDLRQMLIERIPEARRSQIDVFVMDVTVPAEAA